MEKRQRGLARLKQLLEGRGLKYTYQRKRIYEETQLIETHFDAEELYRRFKNQGERISRDTVYRTLPLLLEAGVVQMSIGAGKKDFFERRDSKSHHDHMVCLHCGKIIEFFSSKVESIQAAICKKFRFLPSFYDRRIYGYCHKCS